MSIIKDIIDLVGKISFIASRKIPHFIMSPVGIVIVLLIALWVLNTKFRRAVYVFISKAEVANITKDTLFETIDKIQDSDLDDRMVYVIAEIIRSFPLLSLIPKIILVKFLNFYVQKAFNGIKILLDTKKRTPRVALDTIIENPLSRDINYEELVISKGSDMAVDNLEKLYAKFSHKEEVPTHPKVEEYVARAEGVVTAAEFLGFSTPSKVSDTIKEAKKASKKVDSAIEEINVGKEILKGSMNLGKSIINKSINIKEEEDAN